MVTNFFNSRNVKRLVIFCSLFSFGAVGNIFAARPKDSDNCNASKHTQVARTVKELAKPTSFRGRCRLWFNRKNTPRRLFWLGLVAATTTAILRNDNLNGTVKVLAISGILSTIFTLSRFSNALDRIGGAFKRASTVLDGISGITRDQVEGVVERKIGGPVRTGLQEELRNQPVVQALNGAGSFARRGWQVVRGFIFGSHQGQLHNQDVIGEADPIVNDFSTE